MPSYGEYLKLPELLSLQHPGNEHDELLFIIIHQCYELWFKQVLHEIDYLQQLLGNDDLPRANHTIKRVLTILKMLVAKVDILETMTPLEFLGFRDRLESGSGFQSAQFREFEFALGYKRPAILEYFLPGSPERLRLQRRLETKSVWDAFLQFLASRQFQVPEECLQRNPTLATQPSPGLRPVLLKIYRTDPPIAEFCERLVDLDEGLQEWRYRHVQMVERTIGSKHGTGGSSGADYLRTTLLRPVFPDLWDIRAEF
ncbi:MAG: tryptophan 2,3-dioxygenase [Gemmataceae bacterium]